MVLDVPLPAETLSTFLLVLARCSAWVLVVPLFSARGVPPIARLGISVGLAVFLTPLYPEGGDAADTGEFMLAALGQVAIGLALGLLTAIVLSAVEVAGGLADLASGFSYGAMLDPVSGAQSAAFARLTSLGFIALLFVTEAYQSIIAGFARSFQALPLDHVPTLSGNAGELLGAALSGVFVAALQIGAPMLGVLFLTEVALALATRFVPQANAMTVGLPVKALVAMSAAGGMLAVLPGQIPGLVDGATHIGGTVLR
jgi:flagellar biosynthetic protein FliR